jgi:hypothetical protein
MISLGSFQFPPSERFGQTKEDQEHRFQCIRYMWKEHYKYDWDNIYERVPLNKRREFDTELFWYARRGFKEVKPIVPAYGDFIWFDYHKHIEQGEIIGFSIEKDAYLIRDTAVPPPGIWVKANSVFATQEDALIDALLVYSGQLVDSGPPIDITRSDPYPEERYEANRPPIRRAIKFILAQLEPLYNKIQEN